MPDPSNQLAKLPWMKIIKDCLLKNKCNFLGFFYLKNGIVSYPWSTSRFWDNLIWSHFHPTSLWTEFHSCYTVQVAKEYNC